MQTHEIINRFTEHFVAAGHAKVPSASLILDDPTLLFVNAGMVQFKPYFLGDAPAPYPRATSIQKCVRTGDIEEVGKTTRHNTFFQMAGNFSFGDYFKEGAIDLAWSLVTGAYGIDPDRLWATVYRDDDEAFALWRRLLPEDRIQRRGGKDNYWDMGIPGPGGPCSEIYFDRGPEHGRDGGPEADEDRYLEIWNLVFMQDVRGERSPKDDFPPIGTLPKKNIDTGMGIERVATLLQGVASVYDTDLVRPVIARAEEFSGRRYGVDEIDDVRFRVIADHARSGVMIIGDGVTPSNEGRGYVLRRLLRRIVRSARLLGVTSRCCRAFAEVVRDAMAPSYPEIADRLRAHRHRRADRGGDLPPDPLHRLEDLRRRGRRDPAVGLHAAARRPGVQAARHLRLPDRPDARDGRRGRADRRRAGLPHADGRAAQPGQGRRGRAQARLRRRHAPTAPCSTSAGGTTFLGYTDLVAEAKVVGLRGRRGRGARGGRGHGRRGDPRPHPVLRRGRRPAGRHRLDPRRRVRRRRHRRAVAGRRAHRAPRHRARRRDHGGSGRARRGRHRAAGGRSRGRTPPPTSSTPGCARPSATPPRRRAR